MYSVNGDYGQVRIASLLPGAQSQELFSLEALGWHKCNDKYEISRPQGCENHLILITVGGCGHLRIRDKELRLTPGTVALVPRGVPSIYNTPKGGLWEFYWVHPCGKTCDVFLDKVAERGIFCKRIDPVHHYEKRVEEILKLCTERNSDTQLYISRKMSEIVHMTAIDLYERPKAISLSEQVIAYIEQHFREEIELDEISKRLFVSTAHMIRTFKKQTGVTPYQYIIKYRLLSSEQLLKFSDLSIEEIASQIGFSSSSHFISNFRKQYGITPKVYRRNNQ
ncbi:MAG: helix-turn-helix domain-containing protein [Clostridia bacterium]|nr:helix-turn-helix domain-containing protein [Clostridia bacterium]